MRIMMIGAVVFGLVAVVAGNADSQTARHGESSVETEQPNRQDAQHTGMADRPVMSLLDEELKPAEIPAERRAKLEQDLAQAKAAFDADPTAEDAIIWYGRRLAYLGRYWDAIQVYSDGLTIHTESAKLLRHRGHRYITLREFHKAYMDLQLASELIGGTGDEVEPDGMPNTAGIPTSTLHTNIHYHLGLVAYLIGAFEFSRDQYAKCLNASTNDDMRIAASYWMFLNNKRMGKDELAKALLESISAEMNVIENETYQRLLLLYKGEIKPEDVPGTVPSAVGEAVDDATMAYGVAMWHLFNGREDEARARFERIAGKDRAEDAAWAAFGYIAAEAELARPMDSPQRAAEERGRDGG